MKFSSNVIKEREQTQATCAHFENVFDKATCEKIINYCKSNLSFIKGGIGGSTGGKQVSTDIVVKSIRDSDIAWMRNDNDTSFIFQKIIEKTNQINNFYNFDIIGITEPIQFTSYDGNKEEHFDWHLDMGAGYKSRRKLSLIIQLSDENDYEGGECQIEIDARDNKPTIGSRKRGSMIFFPSYLRHRITPVTFGHRYSLVSWLSGQPYR